MSSSLARGRLLQLSAFVAAAVAMNACGSSTPAPAPSQPAASGAPAAAPGGGYGLQLPPAPASQKRTIGFLMGLLTAIGLIGFAILVLIISKIN